ncbi:S-layer homology domain-containing protein [Paenibacillus rigui]|uniref:SLH domain-containing protein n=1 Tax=Paenibacillus rigui TaxID=554312 RepID=A0A229UMA4_9BACL|nr:S-layer homology domain-containing protein [Paenibacillus rigui]OXM84502.1 hypothetical protein CF651_20325 [Paenibacillus rigui]
MNRFRKVVSIVLLLCLMLNVPLAVWADEANQQGVTVISNPFVKVTVDNSTGRFAIRTVEGQPVRKNDNQVDMMFRGDDPESSFTTFRIDGTDYIFGNPYKFAPQFFSEVTKPQIVSNPDGTQQIETVWSIKGVQIKQILMLYMDVKDKQNSGNVNVRYEVTNQSGADVQVGTRILLDTMVGGNDGPAFQVGAAYKVPLHVERKLVDESKLDPGIGQDEKALYTLPAYWVMKDNYDPSNPLATNVMAYGLNNFSEKDINIVDEMIVGHWNKLANTKWDYQINPNLDFTTDTNDYGTADSAVALYWNPDPVAQGGTKTFETVYGLGEIVQPDKVFSVRYIDPVQQLATVEDGSAYANEGVFDVTAEIENLASYNMQQTSIQAELQLNNGLKFVDIDEKGQVKRDAQGKIMTKSSSRSAISFQKEATPEEAKNGIQPKYKPGDTVTATFKVQAQGKAWPTTKEYLLSVSSPETEAKLESVKDESVKAQYMSSKANFVFLPAVGTGSQTFVYALSPEEAYTSDVKYITLNLSNIEAYNTGSDTAEPNFDLYLKESATGNRYKVPVKDSVILQPANDGQVGDMRITYRTGDRVGANGLVLKDADGKELRNLGPSLPLGEYQVEIDYKGDQGDDPEAAKLYDITTSQKFVVSENENARLKKANLLAVVKKTVDLSQALNGTVQEDFEEAYPGYRVGAGFGSMKDIFMKVKNSMQIASKLVDPELDLGAFLPETKVPAYRLAAFESEEELEKFKEEGRDSDNEVIVEIAGMINRIGTGDQAEYVVDTRTEPAIINKSVAYRGKDMVFAKGQLDVFNIMQSVPDYKDMPLFNSLNVKGDGTLSVASSGFVFHKGEWTLDFYNGFDKSLSKEAAEEDSKEEGGEDDSLNGSLNWAVGGLGDRLNPLRQLMLKEVYFNRHSLFSAPSFSINGFTLKFNDFILREKGVSFGGSINLKIADSEIKNVMFNNKGFVGIDADLNFDLNKSIGLIESGSEEGEDGKKKPAGVIKIVHYEQKEEGIDNTYGLDFDAKLRGLTEVAVQIEFKQVEDKRILPNIIAFSAELGDPGVLVAGGTYLTAVRGAIRDLADTIAGGSSDVPLTVEAGADISFGVKPATFYGSIDLTLKKSGIKLVGKLDYSSSPSSSRVAMLKEATVSAQWMTPWFVSASAEIDVLGWDVIIGKASIFIGQNLIKNRIDFEGFVSARVQVPSKVPIVGGMALGGVSLGANNDKMWGSVSVLFISLGITYYFDGDIEFGTSGQGLPEDGLLYLQVQDPESGPKLVVFGHGVQTLATSWVSREDAIHEIEYHSVADGVSMLDNGSMKVGIGGIKVSDEGKLHEIPMNSVTGDALLELGYTGDTAPNLVLKDNNGQDYKLIYDETKMNPQANAFTQIIQGKEADSKHVYVAIPHDRVGGGTWKLYADQPVESKLLNIPQAAKLDEVTLDPSRTDANQFTASWKVSHAKPGDTVNLYLTKDAFHNANPAADGDITAPGETGLLIAKGLSVDHLGSVTGYVTTGHTDIDVTRIPLLGDTEDIRGLLSQGDYYLRAELSSSSNYQTRTTVNRFEIIDPLAPSAVNAVSIQPAGNGYFELSFKPAMKKPEQTGFEHSYAIDVLQQQNGKLGAYPNFSSMLMSEEELKPFWNEQNGTYEHIRLGGWTQMSGSNKPGEDKNVKYAGLETGQEYIVGVSAATKPSQEADKHQNIHYANRIDTASTLLPVPAKPKLSAQPANGAAKLKEASSAFMEVLSNTTEQSIGVTADQPDVEVEALYDNQSIGTFDLANQGGGSAGTLHFTNFTTDGRYAIELKSRNKITGDYSITMLYLTVDTIAPVLYIDTPITGDRTKDGKIRVAGTTSNDAALEVNGQQVAVKQDGTFAGEVNVTSSEPTLKLEFQALDHAGNSNRAAVQVTNGSYRVPTALVLQKVPNLKVGETQRVSAMLRYTDGKDQAGKTKYVDIPVSDADRSKLQFSNYAGEALAVAGDGKVDGLREGAGIAKAEYSLSDDVTLQAMTVVAVEAGISAYTSAVSNDRKTTKVNIVSAGDITDAELVYRTASQAGGTPAAPKYQDDVSGWSVLPANGIIPVAAGDRIALAKRTKGGKNALAVSGWLPVTIWSPSTGGASPGGGGFGGLPAANTDVLVGGDKVASEKKDDRIYVQIDQVNAAPSPVLSIVAQDPSVNGYTFDMNGKAVAQAVQNQQRIQFTLPFAKLAFPASAASGLTGNLKIAIDRNSRKDIDELEHIAQELGAALLGGGQGVTFDIQAPNVYQDRSVSAAIAVPDGISPQDITAVIVKDSTGSWTTVPWQLDAADNQAFVKVLLTGSGSVALITHQPHFADVAEDNWAKSAIDEAAGRLFMLGRDEEEFSPDSTITRAEYPTVLLRVLGLMNENPAAEFGDIQQDDWFSRSVAVAAGKGIVNGFSDGTYRPEGSLSRMEAMVMVGRSLKLIGAGSPMTESEVNSILAAFEDEASIPDWAREAVALCIQQGIIEGQDQSIQPSSVLTRAQAAAIAVRFSHHVPAGNP